MTEEGGLQVKATSFGNGICELARVDTGQLAEFTLRKVRH